LGPVKFVGLFPGMPGEYPDGLVVLPLGYQFVRPGKVRVTFPPGAEGKRRRDKAQEEEPSMGATGNFHSKTPINISDKSKAAVSKLQLISSNIFRFHSTIA
jgi:hypothetical protein